MRKQKVRKRAAACMLWLLLWTAAWEMVAAGEEKALPGKGEMQQRVMLQQQQEVPEPLEELALYAQAAVLMDASSGRVLYEKNGFTPMAMASTTKIMTCIIALEYGDTEEMATVSRYAASMPKVKLGVKQGESYRIRDLLFSLMLESHNDSAVVIAEHIGQKYLEKLSSMEQENEKEAIQDDSSRRAVQAFASLMNRKAAELGCADTWFITPNGLDATQILQTEEGTEVVKEHTTTAAELARIMAYCVGESPKTDEFLEITRTPAYSFSANGRSFQCTNHNAFLNMMDGALSGKTGFTNKAGYCYVGALRQGEKTFTVALLACGWPNHKTYKWSDTRELMQYGLEHYTFRTYREAADAWLAGAGVKEALSPVPVWKGCSEILGRTAYTALAVEEIPEGGMLLREDEEWRLYYEVPELLQAPVLAGSEVGELSWQLGGVEYARARIQSTVSVEAITFQWCLEQIFLRFRVAFSQKVGYNTNIMIGQ